MQVTNSPFLDWALIAAVENRIFFSGLLISKRFDILFWGLFVVFFVSVFLTELKLCDRANCCSQGLTLLMAWGHNCLLISGSSGAKQHL